MIDETDLVGDPTPEIDPEAPRAEAPTVAPPARLGVVAGLVAGAGAVGVGLVFAQLIDTVSPTDAVGSEFIDRVPRWLKQLAIDWFGTNDKRALRVGMFVVMAAFAAFFGARSLKDRWAGVVGFSLMGVVGALAVAHRPQVPNRAVLAPLVGSAAGIWFLLAIVAALVGRWRADRTPRRSRVPLGMDRRRFVTTTGAVAAVAAATTGTAIALEKRRISRLEDSAPDALPRLLPTQTTVPLAELPEGEVNPATPFITPNDDFYRIDTALSFPRIDVDRWTLRIHGKVDRELEISYADLLARPQVERTITLACVSNEVGGDLIGNAVWQGVLLADLLREAGVHPDAEQVFSTSRDGWTSGFPTSVALDGRDALVAIGMNGEPLPLAHGFPARLVVPGLYGYVSATKWLTEIKLTTWDDVGYWVPRGWSREAPIKTHSRIDVPRRRDKVREGQVMIAGVAWAQHRGIAKVEVQIDDGDWQEATLGGDDVDDAWRQWALVWEATAGTHQIKVRATDKTGETQTDVVRPVAPDGATGYHTRRVTVNGA